MIRRPALALVFALAAVPLLAEPSPRPDATADHSEYDLDSREWAGSGHASIRDGNSLLTADRIIWAEKTDAITAIGHVVLTSDRQRLLADRMVYHRNAGSFTAVNLRAGQYPFYIEGATAEGTMAEVTVHRAKVTYGEPGPWQPTIKAETIVFSPGHYLRLLGSLIGLGNSDFFPIPHFRQDLGKAGAVSDVSFEVGYRSFLGGTADLGVRLPVLPDTLVGGDVGVYTKHGVMVGPAATYQSADGSDDLKGSLESGYIRDSSSQRGVDVLGSPISEDRHFVDWKHQQQVTDNLTLDGQISWWSDSDVLRDFRPKEFYPVQMPDSFVESVYTGENSFLSAFARLRPNSYEAVQERLPELRYDQLPTAIGGGFYERTNLSAVSLVAWPPGGGPELASNRLDAFYGLTRPISPTDWFTFTPTVGGRVTNYSDTIGAAAPGGYTRAVGEVGFDAMLRSSGTFDYKNSLWDINGLRHLLTPHITYRYIPDADAGQRYIPNVDGQTFSTYLQPLDLGDIRAIDSLHRENTLRLGIDNTLQTREATYGSRDLITFNVADDLNFIRQPGEPDFSDIHIESTISPTPWLSYGVENIFSPETFTLREYDSSIILHDGDAWTLRLANDFLRHEDDAYLLDYRQRINEAYSGLFLVQYSARQNILTQVAAGLVENLSNTWKLRYLLTYNGGPNREGHFGFSVEVDTVKF